jgi:hypothetical protein
MKIRSAMIEIEKCRDSALLVFAATHLDLELLPTLYDTLKDLGRVGRLDVLFFCRGGNVTAARRIGLMFHEFGDLVSFIVPDRCESSGTITALAAHEIIAGPAAIFSPVDPHLQADSTADGPGPSAISAAEVRLFGSMAREWFGLDEAEAGRKAISILCESIFPTTLTAFYRSELEVRRICEELLSLHMGAGSERARSHIVDQLLPGCYSHAFALAGADLAAMGLPVRRDPVVEDLAWEIARSLRAATGSGVRTSQQEDWSDAWLVTRNRAACRRRSPGGLHPTWHEADVD